MFCNLMSNRALFVSKQVYLNKRKEKTSIGDVRSARQSTQNISVGGKIVNVKTKDMFT